MGPLTLKTSTFFLCLMLLAFMLFRIKLAADTYTDNHYILGINKKLVELEKQYGENFMDVYFPTCEIIFIKDEVKLVDGKPVNVFKELVNANLKGLKTKMVENQNCIVDEFGNLLVFLNQKHQPTSESEIRHIVSVNTQVRYDQKTLNLTMEHTKVYSFYYGVFNIFSLGADGKFSNFCMQDHKTDILDATKNDYIIDDNSMDYDDDNFGIGSPYYFLENTISSVASNSSSLLEISVTVIVCVLFVYIFLKVLFVLRSEKLRD